MLVIPAELLSKGTGHTMRSIDRLRVGVVVTENREDWTFDVTPEHVENAGLGILYVRT